MPLTFIPISDDQIAALRLSNAERNDSSLGTDAELKKAMAGGYMMSYGDHQMLVQRGAVDEIRHYVAGLDADEHRHTMLSCDRELHAAAKKLKRGALLSKRKMDNFHSDLLLWNALKEMGN
jgi:hypothetical protein